MPKKRKPRTPRKICSFCHESYHPDYRHVRDQQACDREECRAQRHNRATAKWKKDNPEKMQDNYTRFVKPWRQCQRKLKAAALEASGVAPLTSHVHHVCDQIIAYVCGCFARFEHDLGLAGSRSAPPAKKNDSPTRC